MQASVTIYFLVEGETWMTLDLESKHLNYVIAPLIICFSSLDWTSIASVQRCIFLEIWLSSFTKYLGLLWRNIENSHEGGESWR